MKSTTTKTSTKKAVKSSSNGTRKAPVRTIVKRLPGAKKSRYIAVLECGHRYSKGAKWHRTHLRCRACLNGGPVKTKAAKAQVKKVSVTKTPKPATVNGTKASNGGAA